MYYVILAISFICFAAMTFFTYDIVDSYLAGFKQSVLFTADVNNMTMLIAGFLELSSLYEVIMLVLAYDHL